jgi:hypothetical protein
MIQARTRTAVLLVASFQLALSQSDVAERVGNAFVLNANDFINWEGGWQYGGAITCDGLYAAAAEFPKNKSLWLSVISKYLDAYGSNTTSVDCSSSFPYGPANQTRNCAFEVVNKVPIAWQGTVGDHLGLFPICNLHRYMWHGLAGNNASTDLKVAVRTAEDFVLPYPHHLSDGTFSRVGGIPGDSPSGKNNATTLWADDQFMGLTLIARLSALTNAPAEILTAATRRKFIDVAAQMQIQFFHHMRDPHDGLVPHGINAATGARGSVMRITSVSYYQR